MLRFTERFSQRRIRNVSIAWCVILFHVAAITLSAQNTPPGKEAGQPPVDKRRFNIYYHLGSVQLPEGYQGFITKNFTDAWMGRIESKDGKFVIYWGAGLIERIFEKEKGNLLWKKSTERDGLRFVFGQTRNGSENRLLAQINNLPISDGKENYPESFRIQFSAAVTNDEQMNAFNSIVDSYQKPRCDACRTFRSSTETKEGS